MFAASKTAAAAAGTPPPSTDPQFNYVTMLLHGDGTNGAQNNTFVDSSTNNFTITRNGTPTQGSFSPYGDLWSNQFSGSGQYLTAPNNTAFDFGSGDFTVEMWIYPTGTAGDLFTKRATTGNFPPIVLYRASNSNIGYSGSTTGSSWDINGSFSTGTIATPLNTWSHIALVRRSGTFTSYVNGIADLVVSGVTAALMTNTSGITVAAGSTAGSAPFPGYMSNTRILKGTAVYTSAFTPSTTPLTAVSGTSLLTCQSNRFRDNSSNNFAITVTGTPSVQRFSPFDPTAEYSTSVIGGSGYFSGSGQYLSFTGTNAAFEFGTGDWTIETWAYATTIQAQRICDFRPGPGNGPYVTIGMNGSGQFDYTANSAIRITGTTVAKPNTWFHVSVCRSGTSTRLFINGVQEGVTYSDSTSYIVASGRPFIAADSFSPGTSVWAGYLSNFRMLKGTALYTAAFTPPTAPLTAITNTSLLLNTVNAGIFDNAMMNDLVTVGNAQVSTAVKKYGTGSMAFDGSGDYLTIPSSDLLSFGTGDFTVECWCYFNSLGGANYAPVFTNAYLFYVGSLGQVLLFNGSTNVASGPNGAVTTGAWTHLAYTRSSGTVRLFVNGVQTGSNATVTASIGSGSPNLVGRHSTVDLNGYIDDLRITKGIARYTANFTPPTAAFPNN